MDCVEPDHRTRKMVKGCGREREPVKELYCDEKLGTVHWGFRGRVVRKAQIRLVGWAGEVRGELSVISGGCSGHGLKSWCDEKGE